MSKVKKLKSKAKMITKKKSKVSAKPKAKTKMKASAKKKSVKKPVKKAKSSVKSKKIVKKKVVKSKAKKSVKSKTKAKGKQKPVAKSKVKAKKKSATKKKVTAKKKTTSKLKAKTAKKSTSKAKIKVKKSRIPAKVESNFNDKQKGHLLSIIEQLISLHRNEKEGLRGLDGVDRILDKYNQQYTSNTEKFDAIVKIGVEKDPAFFSESILVPINSHRNDEVELYKLLESIWQGKMDFKMAKAKMNTIFKESKDAKVRRNLERHTG